MRNLTLMTDLYQLTMMNAYFRAGVHKNRAVFDLFFRENRYFSYAVMAGLEQAADYIQKLKFSGADIEYLKGLDLFDEDFIAYLSGLTFTGDIFAAPEGTLVFPGEPIVIVNAPLLEAQLIETALLNIINFQTLIATKASRVVEAAAGSRVVEFGLRRASGPDAGIYGARSAIIGGADATSNLFAGKQFGLDVAGTHAHSFVMSFSDELTAFRRFAEVYPNTCILLVDTYDTLKSGVPNAIKVFDELKAQGGSSLKGIRIDSGDLAYLSKRSREMLDAAGHKDAIIFVSGDLDENVIENLRSQGAKIDAYGVGTKLITGGESTLGGVYKLSAIYENGVPIPKMKISDSLIKMTNPGFKTVYRIYENGKAYADLIALKGEGLSKPLTLTHPVERWKTSTLKDYTFKELLVQVFKDGKLVYTLPDISEIKENLAAEKSTFWEEYLRNTMPHVYKVDLSDELYSLRQKLLKM